MEGKTFKISYSEAGRRARELIQGLQDRANGRGKIAHFRIIVVYLAELQDVGSEFHTNNVSEITEHLKEAIARYASWVEVEAWWRVGNDKEIEALWMEGADLCFMRENGELDKETLDWLVTFDYPREGVTDSKTN